MYTYKLIGINANTKQQETIVEGLDHVEAQSRRIDIECHGDYLDDTIKIIPVKVEK